MQRSSRERRHCFPGLWQVDSRREGVGILAKRTATILRNRHRRPPRGHTQSQVHTQVCTRTDTQKSTHGHSSHTDTQTASSRCVHTVITHSYPHVPMQG